MNPYALYNFRAKLPAWLEQRSKRASETGDIPRAVRLGELIHLAENRLIQTAPFDIAPFSSHD